MNRLMHTLAVGAIVAFGAANFAIAADTADPAIGTWNLNLAKSHYHDGTAPKSMTRTYTAGVSGTDMKVTGVNSDGSAISQSVTLTYDGKPCTITGAGTYDTLTLTKVNGTTVKSVQRKDGKIVGHTTRTISQKGKVLTLSTAWKTEKGGTTRDLAVFDKQ